MNDNFQHIHTEKNSTSRRKNILKKLGRLGVSALGKCAAGAGVLLAAAVISISASRAVEPAVSDMAEVTDSVAAEVDASAAVNEAAEADEDNSEYVYVSDTAADIPEDEEPEEEDDSSEVADVAVNSAAAADSDEPYCVYVKADGKTVKVTVDSESTVDDILGKAGVELDRDDLVSMDTDEIVSADDSIVVSRVEYVTEMETVTMDYETEYRDDENLPVGTTEVLVDGREGEAVIETLVRYVDGVADSTEVVAKNVTKHAIDRVILTGTMEESQTAAAESTEPSARTVETAEPEQSSDDDYIEDITMDDDDVNSAAPEAVSLLEVPSDIEFDENGIPLNYIGTVTGESCAYTAEPGALMSTGKEVFQGYVAVDPDIIPYGSRLYIVADDGSVYGYAIAADTGYSVRAGHIVVDLFMNEYDDCIEWGRKNVTIYILG
ncbi:MAG: G5 domain-containing protein [Huintestinicola sp.]